MAIEMPELLSKSHRIIEKGVMEFRPFGQELNGERIQDVSGVTVRANLEYLKDLVTRSRGREAGEAIIEELVDLLNARIPDQTFHVTPEFLTNPWNSYSYEFVMFLNEFCAILSGDDLFCFHLGREKFLSPVIQLLGRPLSIVQIYKLYPHFVEKFTKGALVPEVVSVTNGMAVMRLRFSDRGLFVNLAPIFEVARIEFVRPRKPPSRRFPRGCLVIQPAMVQDNSCIGDGAAYCEWTFTWQPTGKPVPVVDWGWSDSWTLWSFPLYKPGSLIIRSGLRRGLAVVPGLIFWLAGRLWADRQEIQAQGKIIQEQHRGSRSLDMRSSENPMSPKNRYWWK